MDRAALTARLHVAGVALATVLRDHPVLHQGPVDGLLDDVLALALQHEAHPLPTPAVYGFPSPPAGGLRGLVAFAGREVLACANAVGLDTGELSERVRIAELVADYHANTLLRRA